MKKTAFNTIRAGFLLLGLFVLTGVVRKIGWTSIKIQLTHLKWQFVPILSIGFLWYVTYALAWQQILKQQGNKIPFWDLFRARIAGETVNTMTPANFLGGDPMRIYLLRRAASNVTSLAASVVVDRTINSIAIVAVIFVGAATGFLTIHGMPIQVTIGIPIFLTGSTGLIFFFLLQQKKGLFGSILKLAKRLHIAPHLATKYLSKAHALDLEVLNFYQKSHRAFWMALFFHISGRLLGVFEVFLIGKTITPQFTFLVALLLATLSPVINAAFTFIPGALGVMEGAYSGALYLLGFDPALGFTIQIVKRIRATLWMTLGFLFISFFRNRQTNGCNGDPLRQPL